MDGERRRDPRHAGGSRPGRGSSHRVHQHPGGELGHRRSAGRRDLPLRRADTSRCTTRPRPEPIEIAAAMAAEGLPIVIAQPGLVYGPGDTSQVGGLVEDVVSGGRPLVPSGGGVLLGVHRRHRPMVTSWPWSRGVEGESYMLAGPPAPLAEALRIAARLAGTKGPVTMPTGRVMRSAAAMAALVEKVVRLPPAYRRGDVAGRRPPPTSAARRGPQARAGLGLPEPRRRHGTHGRFAAES